MKNDVIVKKLISYIKKIQNYCTGLDYDSFASNTILIKACVFNLSQMGELVRHIDSDFELLHPEIPWRYIYALINRIVHDYDGINMTLIWEIISEDLEPLCQALMKINGLCS